MNRKTWGALALTAALTGAAPFSAAQQLPDKIRLGLLGVLTGPGAATELPSVKGVEFAVDEINKAGGIAGKPIELVRGDVQTDPTIAVNEARRLTGSEKIHVLAGPFASQYALAIAPVMNQAKVAFIG